MATLLDLSDDTLNLIGEYVHQDNEIQLPSINPHWANFELDTDPQVQQDFLALRATCRRIRSILKLHGLHVIVNDWATVLDWNENAPPAVRAGVRRLEFSSRHLIDSSGDPHPARPRPHEPEFQKIWDAIVVFLRSLVNLEELIIERFPVCPHLSNSSRDNVLSGNAQDFLPNLRSLSVQVNSCRLCTIQLPKVLVPSAPNIQHLKMVHSKAHAFSFRSVTRAWSHYHLGRSIPLQSLYLSANFNEAKPTKILDMITRLVPGLRQLHLYSRKMLFRRSKGVGVGGTPYRLWASPSSEPTDRWTIHFGLDFNQVTRGTDPNEERDAIRRQQRAFNDQLRALSNFSKLEELDLLMVLSLNKVLPATFQVDPYQRLPRRRYLGARAETSPNLNKIKEYEDDIQSAIQTTARLMCRAIPTLRTSHMFTRTLASENDGEEDTWIRWTWNRVKDDSQPDGFRIILDPWIDYIPNYFTRNRDGEPLSEGSDDETSEEETSLI